MSWISYVSEKTQHYPTLNFSNQETLALARANALWGLRITTGMVAHALYSVE